MIARVLAALMRARRQSRIRRGRDRLKASDQLFERLSPRERAAHRADRQALALHRSGDPHLQLFNLKPHVWQFIVPYSHLQISSSLSRRIARPADT